MFHILRLPAGAPARVHAPSLTCLLGDEIAVAIPPFSYLPKMIGAAPEALAYWARSAVAFPHIPGSTFE